MDGRLRRSATGARGEEGWSIVAQPDGAGAPICTPQRSSMTVLQHEPAARFSPKRVVRGLASSILGQVLSGLQAFLLVPFYLRAWGVDGYGRWLAISAAVAHLSLLDLGGQSYIGNSLAYAFAQSNEDQLRKTLELAWSLFLFLAGFAFAGLCAFLLLWPTAQFSPSDRLISALLGAA